MLGLRARDIPVGFMTRDTRDLYILVGEESRRNNRFLVGLLRLCGTGSSRCRFAKTALDDVGGMERKVRG